MADLRTQQSKSRGNKKKNRAAGWVWAVVLAAGLLSQAAEDVDTGALRRALFRLRVQAGPVLIPLAAALVFAAAAVLVLRAVKQQRQREGTGATEGRSSAAVRRPDPRTQSFTRPEPSCIVCDHTGEDHFQRDKAQRIRQLDDWLKNGLIDRDEYKVLKARFERDL